MMCRFSAVVGSRGRCLWNSMPRSISRQASSVASAAKHDRTDLHAAWASLACYDESAAGVGLVRQARRAKEHLQKAGFSQVSTFVSEGDSTLDFSGKHEVVDTDVAHLWRRADDSRMLLAFRGSDTEEDLDNVRDARATSISGYQVHKGIARNEFCPLLSQMSAASFAKSETLVVTGHSLGGASASLFAVLMNDPTDPLGFGGRRKMVDELYAFGAVPVFHGNDQRALVNGQSADGSFEGGIFRALRTVDGKEVQDGAMRLTAQNFHFPKTNVVSLRKAAAPEIVESSDVTEQTYTSVPIDRQLFPLHNPLNYVNWLSHRS